MLINMDLSISEKCFVQLQKCLNSCFSVKETKMCEVFLSAVENTLKWIIIVDKLNCNGSLELVIIRTTCHKWTCGGFHMSKSSDDRLHSLSSELRFYDRDFDMSQQGGRGGFN